MNEIIVEKPEKAEIDLSRLLGAVWKKLPLVGLTAGVCAMATLLGTLLFVAPKYQSSVLFSVHSNTISPEEIPGDISAARGMVTSCMVVLDTRETLEEVLRRFSYVDAKVLGVVFHCAEKNPLWLGKGRKQPNQKPDFESNLHGPKVGTGT